MSSQFHKALLRYYKQLHSVYNEWKKINKKINVSLTALTDQKEALHLISHDANYGEANINKEVQHRIMFNILMIIDQEQDNLFKIVLQLNDIVQDLANFFHDVMQARSKTSMTDQEMKLLIKGSYCQPKLDLLMQWVAKSFEHFNKLYYSISSEVKSIDWSKEQAVDQVRAVLKEFDKERPINKILAYTQYMVDEEFHPIKYKDVKIQKVTDPATESQGDTE